MNNHNLRTTGTLTGNFGRPKVQGKRQTVDLSDNTLRRENLRIPDRNEAFTRMVEAYNRCEDPRVKATLWDLLRVRKATLQTRD